MECMQLGESTWYLPGRVNVGLFRKGEDAWIVDSGLDDEAGRKVAKHLEKRNLRLRRIVATHSNADHCGGNSFLRKRTGCSVAATMLEAAVIENPCMEPLLLWSAFPFMEITGKFFQAKSSPVDLVISSSGTFDESGMEAVPLPGHFLDMIGIRTEDGVLFTGDALFSAETIEKYGIIFVLDVGASHRTLDFLGRAEASWFVPGHAPASREIGSLVRANREGLLRASQAVLDACSVPSSREQVLKSVAEIFGLSMSVGEYLLNSAAVSAHLSWLREHGQVFPELENGVLLWRRS